MEEPAPAPQATHPLVVTVSTYVRGPGRGATPGRPLAILLRVVEDLLAAAHR